MFKRTLFTRGGSALALSAALVVAAMAQAAAYRLVLPAGTVIPVRMDQNLSSQTASPGDRFTATVRTGDTASDLPSGTQVEGVVRDVAPRSGDQPGMIDVAFRRILFPDGQTASIDGYLASLDSNAVRRASDGRLIATGSRRGNQMKFIGIGAGAGLLIGALSRGNTLTDALIGAGLGYLFGQTQGHASPADVSIKPGTEFGVRLDRRVALNVDDTYRGDRYGYSAPYRYDDRYYNGGYTNDQYYNGDQYYNSDRDYNSRTYRMHRTPASDRDIVMMYNGRTIRFGADRPFLRNDVVYVPLQQVAATAGFDYTYDADGGMIRALNGDLRMPINSRVATLYGDTNTLGGPALLRDGVVYVPMQFVVLATGGRITYDSGTRTITLNTDNGY